METGNTVVLLNLENLYESLYDALNQVNTGYMHILMFITKPSWKLNHDSSYGFKTLVLKMNSK